MRLLDKTQAFRKAFQINRIETALLALFGEGELRGTIHTCLGQELISAIFSQLVSKDDVVFSNHRCHGHYLAKHDSPLELIAEIMGKQRGVVQGRGGSQHLITSQFYANGILGGATALACGRAFALKKKNDPGIAICFIGDGALGEGLVYEAMNLAAKWRLPVLFILENNAIAQTTPQSETLAGSIQGRAEAFGLQYQKADVWNVEDLFEKMQLCFQKARSSQASFLEVGCYRLAPHSKGDDLRAAEEKAHYRSIDPLETYLATVAGEERAHLKALEQSVETDITRARTLPHPVYKDSVPSHLPAFAQGEIQAPLLGRLNSSLHSWLAEDPLHFFIGEDVGDPYGGAFKVSKGLSERYPEQVFNFPTSEAALVGFASGAAMGGVQTMIELMFADFMGLVFDQLYNHATKLKALSQNDSWGNFLLRTPTGGGRGYGPTHSQSPEKYFVGMPGLHVFLLHHRVAIIDFYASLMKTLSAPTIVFEPKALYDYLPPALPTAWTLTTTQQHTTIISSHAEADVTIVAFGAMGVLAEEAMKQLFEEEVYVDLVLPLVLHQLEVPRIAQSLHRTGRLVIVEEGTSGNGLADGLVARLHPLVSFTARIICSPRDIVPAAATLESQFLPTSEKIFAACCEVFNE